MWDGWLHERDSPTLVMGLATVIWNPAPKAISPNQKAQAKQPRRKAFIRVHPSAFFQLWEEVIRLAKVQKPSVTVEDLRFEIGSIEITGPNASEALIATLRPLGAVDESHGGLIATQATWSRLATIPPSSLPSNALLSMSITDPRLRHPPRMLPANELSSQHPEVIQLLANWPVDRSTDPAPIFDRNARSKASRSLPSQKSINRRKAQADPGDYPKLLPTDPAIPVLAFATRNGSGGAGTWTVMMPWKCVSSAWNSLLYYPLSTGGTIRFGGINEKRQLAYENSTPWFPADFPGTRAGQQWEMEDSNRRKAEWDRKPKSRRPEYGSLDLGGRRRGEIGLGWSCDWQRLVQGPPFVEEDTTMEDAGLSEGPTLVAQAIQALHHLPYSFAAKSITYGTNVDLQPNALATVKINMLGRGRPSGCARIYRLPTNNPDLRQKWLAQQPAPNTTRSNSRKARLPSKPGPEAPAAVQRSWLAAAILTEPLEPGNKNYPGVPEEVDLLGFVTTGNFSLKEGKGVGIGSFLMSKVMPSGKDWIIDGKGKQALKREHFLCIVRDAGELHGRLAAWELV
jgi:ribonuclease P/MRP protein subunit POP1